MYQRKVSFMEAIVSAMTSNYCRFSGRASRSEFWWFWLFSWILAVVVSLIFSSSETGNLIASSVVSLILLLPTLGLCVRRLHDIGKSGWCLLIGLIPLVGAIILIVWYCNPSIQEANQYGPVPNTVSSNFSFDAN